jgi:hypothetical protein
MLMIIFVQGLLLLQSVIFLHLETKNIWLVDGLEQCNTIHIWMTSAAICVGSDNEVSSVTERANKPPVVTATCIWIICTGPCLNTSHFVTTELVVVSCTHVDRECLNGDCQALYTRQSVVPFSQGLILTITTQLFPFGSAGPWKTVEPGSAACTEPLCS